MQKCDAKRPCTTCISANIASECVYNKEKRSQPAGTYPSHVANGRLPEQRSGGPDPVKIPTAPPCHSLSDGVFADVSSPTKLDRIPSTSSDATWVVTKFESDQAPHEELVLVHRDPSEQYLSLDATSPVFTVPFFFLQTIPPEPWIPLSFLGEEKLRVQSSDTAATDLDMKWYGLE
jgi:hypothetical protein